MHSFVYRANALAIFSVLILALICGIASFSDNFNSPYPTAQVELMNINRFQKRPGGDDEVIHISFVYKDIKRMIHLEHLWGQRDISSGSKVSLSLNISANLESLFTWNTKQVFVFLAAEYETPKNALNQVSLWDAIIPSKEQAKFNIKARNKYRFIDQGSNLRGKDFDLTLHWHIMPTTGKMLADKLVMTGFTLPKAYR